MIKDKKFLALISLFIVGTFISCSSKNIKEISSKPVITRDDKEKEIIVNQSKIPEKAEDVRPLIPGVRAPNFFLRDTQGTQMSFHQILEAKASLVVFYRGGWCPYCDRQLQNLRYLIPLAERKNIQIIAISPDTPMRLFSSIQKLSLPYKLYSDYKSDGALTMGLGFQADTAYFNEIKSKGIDLESYSGQSSPILPVPAVYIIDSKGWIRFMYANVNYKIRADLKVLETFIEREEL